MSITIKDIAKIAKVSHTTVSRALNNSPVINEETKKRIHALAKELNYIPNYSARSLALDKSNNIGLFFSPLINEAEADLYFDTIRGIENVIRDNYNLVVKRIGDYEYFGNINKSIYDGILVISESNKDHAFIEHILNLEIPSIVINWAFSHEKATNIVSDDKEGAYRMVKYLIENGHTEIAIIEGRVGKDSCKERKAGYIKALVDANIVPRDEYIICGNSDIIGGYQAMNKLLSLSNPPSAVFSCSDEMALGAYRAINEAKKRIPEDISVVGFGDSKFSAFINPPLTTVKRPIEKMSGEGARILIQMIQNKVSLQSGIRLCNEIIIRSSVKSNS